MSTVYHGGQTHHGFLHPLDDTKANWQCGDSDCSINSAGFSLSVDEQKLGAAFFEKRTAKARTEGVQLLKRTFKIDALKCDKCGGRMKLVGVVFDQPIITTMLRALSLLVRAPPIAPARGSTCRHRLAGLTKAPSKSEKT